MTVSSKRRAVGSKTTREKLFVRLCLLPTVFPLTISAVEAQQLGKVYRVGFLDFRLRSTTTDPRFVAFWQGLRELGYVEGQNIVIEYRSAKGKGELLPEATEDLVRLKVDVIVTAGSPLVWNAAKKATRTIPIVMAGGTEDPVEAGVVASLAKPGANITGLTNREVDLHGKRLELLKRRFQKFPVWLLSGLRHNRNRR